jgi:uncharacterized delta-60 repeat protein
MKKILLLLSALLALVLPATSQAKPGQLDKSFGMDGRVVTKLPAGEATYTHLAWGGGGRLVAALGPQLVEYLPNGCLDRHFGGDGRVEIETPEGKSFAPEGLAVDSQGRILVDGTLRAARPGKSFMLASSAVLVLRFLPNGRLDSSFGNEGTALDDFGFPHPTHEGAPEESGPFVESSGLLVDEADRPVVTGSWLSYDPSPCYSLYCYSTSEPFVARLNEDGSLGGGFGSGGVFVSSTTERASDPVQIGKGLLFLAANASCIDRCGGTHAALGRLTAGGVLDPRFASAGLASLPFWENPTVEVDRFGRILLLGAVEGGSLLLQRLSPPGEPDARFGEGGIAWINLPRKVGENPRTLAADHRGRAVFAEYGARNKHSYWVVFRRNAGGGPDQAFSNDGHVWTRMPGVTVPTQVLIGGNGKITVGGAKDTVGGGLPERQREIVLLRYSGGP